jgi:hypothetical protein
MNDQPLIPNLPQRESDGALSYVLIDIPIEIDKLRRLYSAIVKWRGVAAEEFKEHEQNIEAKRSPQWDDYGYDPISEEAFSLGQTERAMFATLGVSIAATAENFIVRVCVDLGLECRDKGGVTRFSIACKSIGERIGAKVTELPGYDENSRARLLGNCFKHNDGRRSEELVECCGGDPGDEIKYENEDWKTMIDKTNCLLCSIATRLGMAAPE